MQITSVTPGSDDLIIENLDGSTPGMDETPAWCFIQTPVQLVRAA